jgi:hypothetical protein
MAPSPEKDGLDLEHYREYLHMLARLQIADRLRGKLNLSGVVQQILISVAAGTSKLGQGWQT